MKGTSTKILVVDDDSNARILMSAVLRKAGYDVSLAGGGEDAIRRFAEERFDMVMLDVDMPDMSGIQICAVLRQQFNDQLPIVMVTGMDDVQSIEEAYESGATDFIMKPINWTLLGHRVRYLLRASKTLLELREAHATNAAILDAIPDTLIRLHETGLVLDVRTDEATDIPGLIPAVGRPLSETYPAEINERLTSQMRRAFESGAIQDIDYSLLDMEGIRHYYETRIALINHTEALCLVRDITARKQAEAELVLSQANLQYAQAVAHLGSWYVNLETRAEEWSLQTYRIFDVREGTAVNHDSIFQLVLPADILAVRQAWQRILAGDSCTVEYRINTRRGVAWMLEKAEAVFDASGRLHRIVGTVQDISERKETENRIARLATSTV